MFAPLPENTLRHGGKAHGVVEGAPAQMLGNAQVFQQGRAFPRPAFRVQIIFRGSGDPQESPDEVGGGAAGFPAEIVAVGPGLLGGDVFVVDVAVVQHHGHPVIGVGTDNACTVNALIVEGLSGLYAPGNGFGGALANGGRAAQLGQESADLGYNLGVPGLITGADDNITQGSGIAAQVGIERPAFGIVRMELNVIFFHQAGVTAAEVAVFIIGGRGENGGPEVAAHELGVADQVTQNAAACFAEAHNNGFKIALGAAVLTKGHLVTGGHVLHQQAGGQGNIGKILHIAVAIAVLGPGQAAFHAVVGAAHDKLHMGGIHPGLLHGAEQRLGIELVLVRIRVQSVEGQVRSALFTAHTL